MLKRTFLVVFALLLPSIWNVATRTFAGSALDLYAQTQTSSAPEGSATDKSSAGYESATVLKTTTRLVVVDVIATKNEKSVNDLVAADFHVLENDKEQKIRNFTFQSPKVGAVKENEQTLPKNIFSNAPQYRTEAALNVILLDSLNTSLANQYWVKNRMIAFLSKLPSDRPIAVYTMGTRLQLLQDFTTDPTALKAAVENLKNKPSTILRNAAGGTDQILPTSTYLNLATLNTMSSASMLEGILRFEAEDTAQETNYRVQYTVDVLRSLAGNLAGHPGRKNLIWISEGFPFELNAADATNERRQGGPQNYSYEIAKLSDALQTAEISVYPVYAGGLPLDGEYDASNGGQAETLVASHLQSSYLTMSDLASQTGGRFFHNRNDLDLAVRESIDDGSTYYILAYYPENKNWKGEFRRLKVACDRPGIKLRYRTGYVAVDPEAFQKENDQQHAREFARALSLDLPVSSGLLFRAAVLPPSEKQPRILVNFLIDPHALYFEDQEDGANHAAIVECAVEAYSTKGQSIKMVGQKINSPLGQEVFSRVMQSGFPCQQSLDLPPGDFILRLGVRDDRTGLLGTSDASVTVPEIAAVGHQN